MPMQPSHRDAAWPRVAVVIPCYNEAGHIAACLGDVFAQDYPPEQLRVIVADGMSTDGTRDILDRLGQRWNERLKVVDNPRRRQAAALAAMIDGLVSTSGSATTPDDLVDVIVRMDVHARYAPDYVRQCVAVLDETGADNVGGAARPLAYSDFQRALASALSSPLGVGGAGYRDANREGLVDTVFPGAFRRDVFERVGNFDPDAIANEDAEFNQRLLDAGGRIYLSRRIVVHYVPRGSMPALARQYFSYGQGRARTFAKHGRLPTIRPLLPAALLAGLVAVVMTNRIHRLAKPIVGGYLAGCLAEALRVGWRTPPRATSELVGGVERRTDAAHPPEAEGIAPADEPLLDRLRRVGLVAAIFPVLHLSHGTGFWTGLWRRRALLVAARRRPTGPRPTRASSGATRTPTA